MPTYINSTIGGNGSGGVGSGGPCRARVTNGSSSTMSGTINPPSS